MAPPPTTPSPHRFITSKPTNPTPRPTSSLRFQQQAPQPSTSQFASAPRFNFSSTQKPAAENAAPTTQYSSPLSRRPRLPAAIPTKNVEEIEERSWNEEDEEGDDDAPARSTLRTQPTNKRRRPNPPEAITISSDPPSPSSPPSTPPLPTIEHKELLPTSIIAQASRTQHPPRFVLPSPTPSTTTPSIPSRPPLILPPRSPTPPPETPAFFSPHRRGQKYVPGGFASTVRDWIVEAAQVGHTHAHARKGGSEVWDVKFRVGESRSEQVGAGMVLVRERGGVSGWILAGKGRGDEVVEVGCLVGIKEPTWEIEIERERWHVGLEWKVLDG